jgi:purine-binding chemotaxis protein CheW
VETDRFRSFNTLSEAAADVLRQRAESLAQQPGEEHSGELLELLTFIVGEEWYAVDIESVLELHSDLVITPVPSLPEHILGVVNIRGEITSVTDFRRILGKPDAIDEEIPVIVVGDDETETALVVDGIGDIIEVPRGGLEPPLSVIDKQHIEYVEGSVESDGRLLAIVNLRKVLEPIETNS